MAVSHPSIVIFEIFMAMLKSCTPFKNPYTRESIVTISLFYQLESFSSYFATPETKLNFHSFFAASL
jgi:hypothetical protein